MQYHYLQNQEAKPNNENAPWSHLAASNQQQSTNPRSHTLSGGKQTTTRTNRHRDRGAATGRSNDNNVKYVYRVKNSAPETKDATQNEQEQK